MGIKISNSDVKWSYISLALSNGINIVLLPFILIYLNSKEVGLWYAFAAIAGLVVILDFGFMTTLSRNVTFVWSGAQSIKSSGYDKESINSDSPNYGLFVKLFKTTKLIYLLISLVILILMCTIGTLYVYSISKESIDLAIVFFSWTLYFLAVFLNMRFAYWNAILKGIGAIKRNQQILIATKITQLTMTIIFLVLGYGLIGVSLAYLISVITNRVLAHFVFFAYQNNKEKLQSLMKEKVTFNELKKIAVDIWPNTYKQGLISISNYISLRSLPLISASFLGLSITAALGLLLQIITVITVVSNTFFNTYLPQLSSYRIQNRYNLLESKFKKAISINYIITLFSFTILLLFSEQILNILGSDIEMPSISVLITLLAYYFLHNNHSLFAGYLATANTLLHYKAFIISSLLTLIIQLFSVFIVGPSIWTLLLPMVIIQLFYNNWKWPLSAIKEININKKFAKKVEI
ncbi:O-unit flippase-like protein [Planococcus sp. NCCP-2050]|uniref:O-unit flippase-like protein n=1 Tax=Planococcus sp. NCCP-2050 TaxID=2944679 RepID=UPI00203ED9F6|nr:O-unit flippase-like protein [Planococcus sp. NCCP-2050]GKW45328.1 hypothetical protein NCCP2050_10200 [Planococcus sp. NCCP-2050]